MYVGRTLRCPKCRRAFDILEFKPLIRPEPFQEQLNWITKCPDSACRFIFSPIVTVSEVIA